ncbi:MAG: AMP-binding protein, partial [Thermoplasmatales archaeon]|nr:AMP-binding protein [Thermoplasmatales archaeon]
MIKGFPSTMNDDWQLNVNKLIDYAGKTHGDSQVVSSRILQGGKTHRLNYRTVSSRVSAVSAQLKALGIKPGDRIAVLGWNDHRYFELYFAISGIGAVMLQLNLRLNPDEVTYILDHSRARALFVDDSLLNLAEILSSKHKFDFVVVLSDGKVDTTNQKLGVVYSYEYFV